MRKDRSPRTPAQLLDEVADERRETIAVRYLHKGEDPEEWTYQQLIEHIRHRASLLSSFTSVGQRALLLLPSDFDHASTFLACLYAGVVAVPVHIPESGRLKRVSDRLRHIVADADPDLILSTRTVLGKSGDEELLRDRKVIAVDDMPAGDPDFRSPFRNQDDLAFLQYSSGSTGAPKAVCNTQASLMHQVDYMRSMIALMQRGASERELMHTVSWLPLYHDMGLIFGMLGPLLTGGSCTFMRPSSFSGDPRRWFEAISQYRGNTTSGPDFSYQMCCDAFDEGDIAKLDLSCVRYMANGAEPIRPETMTRVRDTFSAAGLAPQAISSAYGLAEAGLIVSTACEPREPRVRHCDRVALSAGYAQADHPETSRTLVGCGNFFHDWHVRIVDPSTRQDLPDLRTGEIWIAGAGLPKGYWNRPDETRETFDAYLRSGAGPFLRTGDIGFLDDGELYLCGRLKDLIIIRGANIHPSDVELSIERHVDAVDLGSACAVQVGEEHFLVLIGEVDSRLSQEMLAAVAMSMRTAVTKEHAVTPDEIVLVRRGMLLRTSSGKIRRQAVGELHQQGDLRTLYAEKVFGNQSRRPGLPRRSESPANAPGNRPPSLETLRMAVAELLDVAPTEVGDHTDLVRLGLDSVMVMRLAGQLGYTGVDVDFGELFDQPTLSAWAEMASSRWMRPPRDEGRPGNAQPSGDTDSDAFEDGSI